MKKLLLAMSALAALALLVPNTGAAQTAEGPTGWYNHIGIYLSQDPFTAETNYTGAPGTITAYVVITNPRNYNYGAPGSGIEQDVAVVGGFEFKVVLPADVYLLGAALPPLTTNFATPPEFLAGTNITVVNHAATCLTLSLGAFAVNPEYVYLTPVQDAPQSVPDHLAITDYNDAFRLIAAFPSSGDASLPVFGLWADPAPVPSEDASWGAVHSLYR